MRWKQANHESHIFEMTVIRLMQWKHEILKTDELHKISNHFLETSICAYRDRVGTRKHRQ